MVMLHFAYKITSTQLTHQYPFPLRRKYGSGYY